MDQRRSEGSRLKRFLSIPELFISQRLEGHQGRLGLVPCGLDLDQLALGHA
jgi:hypothetical protein